MVINLEFIRAIVTAEEALLLGPLVQEVLPFVDHLRQHLPLRSLVGGNGEHGGDGHGEKQDGSPGDQVPCLNEATGTEHELPFEFQVLEVALEAVCSSLDSSVVDLVRHATPVLDELTKNVSTRNFEIVRSLKSDLTRLLARVQKARSFILEMPLEITEDFVKQFKVVRHRRQFLGRLRVLVVWEVSGGRLCFGLHMFVRRKPGVENYS